MAWVYILQGATGRHHIGSTMDLDGWFAPHLRGHTATTRRLGGTLRIVEKKEVPTLQQARKIERLLKSKKNEIAIFHLMGSIRVWRRSFKAPEAQRIPAPE